MPENRREIILGVGGGIAAYKSAELLRRLQDRGFAVTVVPTPSSLNFVGTATWEALSGREVTASVFQSVDEVRHISLAKVAEAILIAPATADLIARIAQGRADDLLTNLILAARTPILLVPAMHPAMWSNAATVANVETLKSRGFSILEPDDGPLTSGDSGKGRMPESARIIDYFSSNTLAADDLRGRKVLVTAGGTREEIDPVRFIGNRSSGRQGVAIAEAARARGADVVLIAANIELPVDSRISLIKVESAAEMLIALENEFTSCDLLFMAAAVADVRVASPLQEKVKREELNFLTLVANPDLLASVTINKGSQVVVAFAAETNLLSMGSAREKMLRKGADVIFLNDVSNGAIFGSENTSGWIIDSNSEISVELTSKNSLAHQLINSALHVADKLG